MRTAIAGARVHGEKRQALLPPNRHVVRQAALSTVALALTCWLFRRFFLLLRYVFSTFSGLRVVVSVPSSNVGRGVSMRGENFRQQARCVFLRVFGHFP